MSLFLNRKVFLFLVSLTLLFLSILGPPELGITHLLLTLDFKELINMYNESSSFFRMPNTSFRLTLFFLSMIVLFAVIATKNTKSPPLKMISIISQYLIFIFLLSFFTSNNIYNLAILLLVILSLIYVFNYSSNKFSSLESLFLLSYFSIFIYPFIHSFFIMTSLSEVDNYVRFLLAIPVYLLMREVKINSDIFIYFINITALSLGFVAVYFSLIEGVGRIRGFTSTTIIFGNIPILFCILSYFSINYFKKNNLPYQYLPYIGSLSSFIAWSYSDTRGSLLALIVSLIILILFKTSRIQFFVQCKKISFIIISSFILIFIFSNSHTRIVDAYEISYNYYSGNTQHHHANKSTPNSIIPRLSLWKGSKNIISDNTLLGVGLNNFNRELEKQINDKKINPIRYDYGSGDSQKRVSNLTAGLNHAHNQYLDIFVKTGFFGFVTLIFFLIIHLVFFIKYYSKDNKNIYARFGITSIIMYMLFMLTHTITSHHQSTIFMVMFMVILAGLCNNFLKRKKVNES